VRARVVLADELDEPRRGWLAKERRKRDRKYARIRRSNGVDDTGPGLHYRLPDPPKCGKVHTGEAGSRLGIGSLMTTQIRCFLCGDSLTRTLSLLSCGSTSRQDDDDRLYLLNTNEDRTRHPPSACRCYIIVGHCMDIMVPI